MDIYQWNSFYCNNSSDYRLIAKFDTAKQARGKVKELRTMLQKHADEYDKLTDEDDFEWPGPPTKTLERFGEKYGHKIQEFLIWGEEGLNDDMPSVGTVDSDLVLFHGYSSGGFGPDIPRILEKAGASDIDVDTGMPLIYAEFTLRKGCEEFADSLAAYVDQREEGEDLDEWMISPPWESKGEQKGCVDEVAFARLPKGRCRFVLPVNPGDMESMSAALKDNATKLVVRIASKEDLAEVLDEELESAESEDVDSSDTTELFAPAGLSFLFTGRLASMSRAEAKARTLEISGSLAKSVTKSLDVLVVGDDGSPLFGGGKKGSKILKAESLNASGASIRIIAERNFLKLGLEGDDEEDKAHEVAPPLGTIAKISRKKPVLELATTPNLKRWDKVIEGFAKHNGIIYAAGGAGSNLFLVSKDDGRSFKLKKISKGRGLRGMLFEGKTMWICGEYGVLLRSSDGGKTFEEIATTGTTNCLFRLFRDDGGTLWCSTEHSLIRSKDDGKTWSRVNGLAGGIWYATQCSLGILLPSSKGALYIANKGKVTKTKLAAKCFLYSALQTPMGSLVVVGASGKIFRSDDGGRSFSQSKTTVSVDLYSVSALSDGRLIVPGDGVVLYSIDDGCSFKSMSHKLGKNALWAAQGLGDTLFIGGTGVIARVESEGILVTEDKASDSKSFAPAGKTFLFTGKLASMSRSDAGDKTIALGGTLAKSVTKTLDVLVVGDDGSPLFGGGKKGSKLLKAEKLNSGGASIHIISETEFLGLKQKDNGGGKVAAKKDSLAFKANTQTPKVRKLNTPSLCWPHVVFGFGIADEKTIYAVGGYGSCVFLVSKDAGKSFMAKKAKKYRRSFRGIACEGKEFFAVGEHGRLIHSPDGKKIEEIELKTSACLYSVFRAQGLLWCTADDGIRRSKDDGKTWTKVKGITGKVFNAKDSAQGILFPNEKGTLFIARKGKVTRSKLAAKAQIWGVAASPLGTILCVGEEGGIYRSTDGGESWKTIKVAAMPKLKSKKASKEVFHTPNSLHCVACSDDGRFVIAGAGGLILASTDDGKSFVRIHQKFTEEWLFGATTWGDSVLLGGEKGLILAVG